MTQRPTFTTTDLYRISVLIISFITHASPFSKNSESASEYVADLRKSFTSKINVVQRNIEHKLSIDHNAEHSRLTLIVLYCIVLYSSIYMAPSTAIGKQRRFWFD